MRTVGENSKVFSVISSSFAHFKKAEVKVSAMSTELVITLNEASKHGPSKYEERR